MAAFVELKTFYSHLNQAQTITQPEAGHFNIFKVEDITLPGSKPVTYSRRNFFKVSLVSGHSKIHYADQCIEIKDSVLVFTNPMIPFFWERISAKHTGYVCVFTEAFFSRFGNIKDYPAFQSAAGGVIPLNKTTLKQFTALFDKMYTELQGDYAFKYDLLRNQLMEVVHAAQKMKPATGTPLTGSNAAERITSLFIELLERQFPIEMNSQVMQVNTPAAFAKQLNVHVNHLNKALKEVTGQTTSQLIDERLISEAKILLRSTNWSIAEIAWCLGFEEPNHFSAFFRTRTKTTPKQFRQAAD